MQSKAKYQSKLVFWIVLLALLLFVFYYLI